MLRVRPSGWVGLGPAAALLLCWPLLLAGQTPAADVTEAVADPLQELGYVVTGGAAPGYVEDRACAVCHDQQYESYQQVGMARSFYRPSQERLIEDLDNAHFYHELSQRHYEMRWSDGKLLFRRYQLAEDGHPINQWECEVAWILGSGNHARSYLYQTPMGELYQLPLGWYSQTRSWGMSPGFDRREQLGVSRIVRRECMFCHNAYPDVPEGSDTYGMPHTFPSTLPEGTGCQRCHGPGAAHVRAAILDDPEVELASTIVNPARLPAERRTDICYGCHLQPSIAMTPVRRFGRGDYSFRPGQPLASHAVYFDPVEEGRPRSERFEINHHPYRLEQSPCFIKSNGKLSCLTCHDPHVKVPKNERGAHYRAACLSCHQLEDCLEPTTGPASDCVACHMAQRRPQDVVLVVMTDHLIRRRPGGPELIAPLPETQPVLVDLDFYSPKLAPGGAEGEVYKAVGVLRAGGGADALAWLHKQLSLAENAELEPSIELARGQVRLAQYRAALATLARVLAQDPDNSGARELRALALARSGEVTQALALLRQLVTDQPGRPEPFYHLGLFLLAQDEAEEAVGAFRQALDLRPNQALAWFQLGNAYARLDKPEQAVASYQRALEVEPVFSRAYAAVVTTLIELDRRPEALRFYRHALEVAADPELVIETVGVANHQLLTAETARTE